VARYILARLLSTIPVIFLVTAFSGVLLLLVQGDPTAAVVGPDAPPEVRARIRSDLHLDDSKGKQYLRWLSGAAHGDLGYSYQRSTSVVSLIKQSAPSTAELVVLTLSFSSLFGVLLGIIAAARRGSLFDSASSLVAFVALSIPDFALGIILIFLLALKLHWFAPSGYVPFLKNPEANLRLMVLPSLALGCYFTAMIMRLTRTAVAEVLGADFIRTARAKGLREPTVLFRHALRPALAPVITVVSLSIGRLVGGAVIIETIFALPGMGRLLVNSVLVNDLPVLQGGIVFASSAVIVTSLVADVLCRVIDPRLRA
jgi:peptide/nickel transport system permease protein